uniref:Uncharacterized protein n=1 Tax=Moniliophthora roreri TaxID=221103 RepID=A0A0W0F1P0_MONRR
MPRKVNRLWNPKLKWVGGSDCQVEELKG